MCNAKSLTLSSIIFTLCLSLPLQTSSFTFYPKNVKGIHLSQNVIIQPYSQLAMAGGGWGKRTKEYTEDEFAREGGDRRGFDAYELQERGDFLRKVRNDQSKFLKRRDEEYLEIAKMAGIADQSGDGVEPMGEFSVDDDLYDDIDVSVQWDDEDNDSNPYDKAGLDYDPDSSITRLDGDNDVAGALGQW